MGWNQADGGGFSWSSTDPDTLGHLVLLAVRVGSSVTFGQTKDRTAATITFFAGKQKETRYCRDVSEAAALLSDLADPDFEKWAQAAIKAG